MLTNDFYATASIIGGVLYIILELFDIPVIIKIAICSVVVTSLRLIAMKFNIHLPRAKEIRDERVL